MPSSVTSCEVMCFWNETVLTPENWRAKPLCKKERGGEVRDDLGCIASTATSERATH